MWRGMLQAWQNLTTALNGSDDEDEERPEEESVPIAEADDDTVLPMNTGTLERSGGEDSGESSESEAPVNHLPVPLRPPYFAVLDSSGYWDGEQGFERLRYAEYVYDRFRAYAPLSRTTPGRFYNELDLVGLEYLLHDVGRQRYDALPFSDICLNGDEPAVAFPLNKGCLDTFVVCRTHDYLYGRLIEDALLACAEERLLPPHFLEASRAHWECRTRRFPLCRGAQCLPTRDHDRKACRHQWVVYTRTDSAFYRFCDASRLQNPYVDYERHDGGNPIQLRISYHLVNFLCGPLLGPPSERGVEQYDAWVMQSIEMIDLWNTAERVELNRNRTFGNEPPNGFGEVI